MSKNNGTEAAKEAYKAWKQQQAKQLVASSPISKCDLINLFDFLRHKDVSLCDHTLKETTAYLEERGLPVEDVLQWLRQNGGYCDCEVIYNVEEKFTPMVGG